MRYFIINFLSALLKKPILMSLLFLLVLFILDIMLYSFDINDPSKLFLSKLIKILFISTTGCILIEFIHKLSLLILNKINLMGEENITVRKFNTQVLVFKRVIIVGIIIIIIASNLMVFESVRNLGAGLLTTAGIVGAIGAFAGQRSLNRLFTGIQIAVTQPVKLGDFVIMENEFGQVEEISLSYVVIKLWDLRRLILPTDYFISQPIQNLSKKSSELLGSIYLYCDYILPIEKIREKFLFFLNASILWNHHVGILQVTNITDKTMEIRCLVSANDARILWDLRCEIREKLIRFIVEHYPECLPKRRNLSLS